LQYAASMIDYSSLLPREMAILALPNVVLFPKAMIPLHIHEASGGKMLVETLEKSRIVAIANINRTVIGNKFPFVSVYNTATAGIIRICRKNDDGSASFILQGLNRVKINRVVQQQPFRTIEVSPLEAQPGATPQELKVLRNRLSSLLASKKKSGGRINTEVLQLLDKVEPPEAYIDMAAFALCPDTGLKQKLLETLDIKDRYKIFLDQLKMDISLLKLKNLLFEPTQEVPEQGKTHPATESSRNQDQGLMCSNLPSAFNRL